MLIIICQTDPLAPEQEKRKKKVPTRIISFDDDNEEDEHREESTTSISAPPTCRSSPTAVSTKDSTSPCLSDSQPQVDSNNSTVNTKLLEWEQR